MQATSVINSINIYISCYSLNFVSFAFSMDSPALTCTTLFGVKMQQACITIISYFVLLLLSYQKATICFFTFTIVHLLNLMFLILQYALRALVPRFTFLFFLINLKALKGCNHIKCLSLMMMQMLCYANFMFTLGCYAERLLDFKMWTQL